MIPKAGSCHKHMISRGLCFSAGLIPEVYHASGERWRYPGGINPKPGCAVFGSELLVTGFPLCHNP
jgi:hypothetical protein